MARWIVLAAVVVSIGACGPKKPAESTGGATIAGPQGGGPQQWCELYCKRIAECWHTIPNSNPNEPPEQVTADCHAQTNNCQLQSATDAMCCSTQADCTNFAACAFSAKNVPATCS
jgi:hypothetical protein